MRERNIAGPPSVGGKQLEQAHALLDLQKKAVAILDMHPLKGVFLMHPLEGVSLPTPPVTSPVTNNAEAC